MGNSGHRLVKNYFIICLLAAAPTQVIAEEQSAPAPELPPQATILTPTVEVISSSPILGSGIEADKVPNATRAIRSKEMSTSGGAPSLTNTLKEQVGSVNLDSTFGNPYQPDLTFRGFVASPVVGVPQGFAVYQNGVRINEAFGDTVNWDLIPDFAIDSMNLTSTNPVFGFNALGGAAAIELKNGFTYQGTSADVSGGSFGRVTGVAQYGKAWGDWALYVGASPSHEDGWRDNSPSRTDKIYTDVGFDNGHKSLHLSLNYANNSLNGMGPTPYALLNKDWGAGVDFPGRFDNTLTMATLRGTLELSKATSLQGNAYFRDFHQDYINGTIFQAQACTSGTTSNLCTSSDNGNTFTVPVVDQNGNNVPTSSLSGVGAGSQFPGYDALSHTKTRTVGTSLQATSTAPIADHGNQLVVGASVDHSSVIFDSSSLLGAFDANRALVPTTLSVTSTGNLSNVSLGDMNTYAGIYLTDTFDMTSALSLTASGRYNWAWENLTDNLGTGLTGNHQYHRFNPAFGGTYKIATGVTAYANYAESNRVPSAAELSCASPTQACSLASFFVADPDLSQVVAHTYETGLRGGFKPDSASQFQWNAGIFRTDINNDIIEEATSSIGRGFFQNDGNTRRQGLETGASYQTTRWRLFLDYSLVAATFQSFLTLNSPFSPSADSSGHIQVAPGDILPSVPKHRVKLGADYWITEKWAFGASWNLVGSQYLVGDESNQNRQVAGYGVVGLHSEYRIKDWLSAYGSIENLLDHRYEVSGTYTNDSGLPGVTGGNTATYTPAPPFGGWLGLRAQL